MLAGQSITLLQKRATTGRLGVLFGFKVDLEMTETAGNGAVHGGLWNAREVERARHPCRVCGVTRQGAT